MATKKINKDTQRNGKGTVKPGLDSQTVKSTRKPRSKPSPKPAASESAKPLEAAAPEAATDIAHAREAHNRITDTTIDAILDLMADGLSLVRICELPGMPNRTSFLRRLAADKELQVRYTLAAEARAEFIAEETLDIADDTSQDTLLTENGPAANTEWISRSKLRVAARQWLLGKLAPKKYGDKVDVNHGGQENNPIQQTTRVVLVPAKQTAETNTRPLPKANE